MEVDDHYNFFWGARLEEAMLNVREAYINFLSLGSCKPDTILLDFQVADRLFSSEVRTDDKTFKDILTLSTWSHDKLFKRFFNLGQLNFRRSLLVLLLLLELFNLLSGHAEAVVRTYMRSLEGQLVDHKVRGVFHRRELHVSSDS